MPESRIKLKKELFVFINFNRNAYLKPNHNWKFIITGINNFMSNFKQSLLNELEDSQDYKIFYEKLSKLFNLNKKPFGKTNSMIYGPLAWNLLSKISKLKNEKFTDNMNYIIKIIILNLKCLEISIKYVELKKIDIDKMISNLMVKLMDCSIELYHVKDDSPLINDFTETKVILLDFIELSFTKLKDDIDGILQNETLNDSV
jgi:hypothetical protein